MKSFDKLFLSEYLIKAAFQKQAFGAPLMRGLAAAAKPLVSKAVANPTGLALARQGLGQVFTGTGQAVRGGLNSAMQTGARATAAAGRGLSAAGRGVANVAANPKVQSGAIGLGAGALGTYVTNSAMGVGASPQSVPAAAAPAAAAIAPAAAPALTNSTPAAPAAAPTPTPAAIAPSVVPSAAQANYDKQLERDMLTAQEDAQGGVAAPVAPAAPQPDYNQIFKQYMGNYTKGSPMDEAKMNYLKGLQAQGVDLTKPQAKDIYNPKYGYGNW